MHFSDIKTCSVPLFVSSGILPIKMLYFKPAASLFHDIVKYHAPPNLSELFTRSERIHSHFKRFSAAGNFHVRKSRIDQQLFSFARIGVKIWNGISKELPELRKAPFKRKLNKIPLSVLKNEEINVDMLYIEISKHILLLN